MSAESDEIRKCIQQLANTFNKDNVKLIIATVTDNSKAETDFVVSVTPINDSASTPINNVKLNAETNDGWLIIPAVNSTILVVYSDVNDYYCLMFSDIEKIVCIIDANNSYTFDANGFIWNDGNLGGMAKTAVLQTKYNNLENKVNQLIAGINSWVPVPNDGGAALKVSLAAWLGTTLTLTTQTEIEDIKIKH